MAATYGTRSPHRVRRPMANFRTNTASPFRHVDLVLVAAVLAVSLFGAVMVYSTTRGAVPPYDAGYLKRVLVFIVLGSGIMAGVALFDYRKLKDFWPFIYGLSLFLLVMVLVPGIGSRTKGTQGWFQLPGFQLQPSELAKLAMIIGFAGLASQFRGDLDNTRVLMLLGLCGAPMFFVLLQPDLGTTLVSVAVSFALLAVAGVRGRILAGLALAAILGTTLVLTSGVLKDYQKARLTTFVEQDKKAATAIDEDTRFNLEQSKIAIGAGGMWGQGLFEGQQTRGKIVPEQRTDFIFSAVGEQLGFVGSGILLALMGTIVWRVWRAAQLARDEFGTLLCTGVMVMLVVQIFENVGMTMGIMPITGIPLPFVSYGGSALLTMFLSMGLVLSVHMRRFS
ncbi:MAG TPA: rod shape-determining protein RodA [Acidimicrobiales bacterium]|nr:rod shape-determining protein RodA [Acidimicrobiales bacterium]